MQYNFLWEKEIGYLLFIKQIAFISTFILRYILYWKKYEPLKKELQIYQNICLAVSKRLKLILNTKIKFRSIKTILSIIQKR